jgi:RND family efflux transporter MFP subunit
MRLPSNRFWRSGILPFLALLVLACSGEPERAERLGASSPRPNGQVIVVVDTPITAMLEVAGVAQPIQQATLSTRLAGTVTAVLVQEGANVAAGQPLARLDDRDMTARREQARAGQAEADAVLADARVQAARFRSLYADSAATRVQLEAAETGLARAEAGARLARASAAELDAVASYSEVRAPFRGRVTRRLVDPGDFVAPGIPLLAVEDPERLRIVVTMSPEAAGMLRPGTTVDALIERVPARAVVEGIVPTGAGALIQVNAIVENRRGQYQSGGAASLLIPQGTRPGILVPAGAIVEQGDLVGVRVETGSGLDLRWVRLGATSAAGVEVLSGLQAGDRVFVPDSAEGSR